MYSAEQLQDARRRQIDMVLGMAGKTLEGVERVVDLNLRTARQAIDDASQAALAALNSRDLASLVQARIVSVQPVAEKASAYSRDLIDIVSSTGAELKRIAETAASDAQEQLLQAIAAAKAQAPLPPAAAATVAETAVEAIGEATREATDEFAQTLQRAAEEGVAAVEAAAEPSIVVTSDAPPKAQPTPRARRSSAV